MPHAFEFYLPTAGAYSAKLLNGTRQRFSGLAGRASVATTLLRMLVTGGPIESNRLMGVAAEALHFQIQVPRIRASPSAGDGWGGP